MAHAFFKDVDFQAFKAMKVAPPILPFPKTEPESYGTPQPTPFMVDNIYQRTESSDGINVEFTDFTYTGRKESRTVEDSAGYPR